MVIREGRERIFPDGGEENSYNPPEYLCLPTLGGVVGSMTEFGGEQSYYFVRERKTKRNLLIGHPFLTPLLLRTFFLQGK
jgi:hypothetical protein